MFTLRAMLWPTHIFSISFFSPCKAFNVSSVYLYHGRLVLTRLWKAISPASTENTCSESFVAMVIMQFSTFTFWHHKGSFYFWISNDVHAYSGLKLVGSEKTLFPSTFLLPIRINIVKLFAKREKKKKLLGYKTKAVMIMSFLGLYLSAVGWYQA